MILLIDAGNTRIKWGVRAAGGWQARGAVATAEAMRLAEAHAAWVGVTAVLACSVAGAAVEATVRAALGPLAGTLAWCRSGAPSACGVVNRYANPAQLGDDRWAALIGAWGRVVADAAPGCLVVNAGTATTIDLLCRSDGDPGQAEFIGGAILPGLALMRSSLASNTARLPLATGLWREHPRATDDAIETGCVDAQIGAVERLARRLPAGSACVLSGGAADALAGHLTLPVRRVEDLVLEGLARVAGENSVLP